MEKEFFLKADENVRKVVFEEMKKCNKVLMLFMKNNVMTSRLIQNLD